ncbi:MAG TPA: Rab family GTPase [Promineifilum sp.]|nr:Rab family GTPase [Promineifilum sp.]HRO23642.1 Rab family GTPase [Promineifilum sp.]HRQ12110.1 Rab family GTPase [Promineifilum sp.]
MKTFQKKICLLGDFSVGKSSLVRRYVEGIFDDKYLTTVGVVVSRRSVMRLDYMVNLLIWDLAGGRDFTHTGYLAGVSGALLVCDLTRYTTLAAYRTYAQQVRGFNPNAQLILIANKSDLVDERAIGDEELQCLALELDAPLFVTSAKTGDMVDLAFDHLVDFLITYES